MRFPVGAQKGNALHLNNKQDSRIRSVFLCSYKLPKVFDAPFRGGIRKVSYTVSFQRNTLDLQKERAMVRFSCKVKTGAAIDLFLPQRQYLRAAIQEKFLCNGIGGLTVHVDESIALIHTDQIIVGSPGRVFTFGQQHPGSGDKKLFASPGILYVDGKLLPIQKHLCNEAVRPCQKNGVFYGRISHTGSILPAKGDCNRTCKAIQ